MKWRRAIGEGVGFTMLLRQSDKSPSKGELA